MNQTGLPDTDRNNEENRRIHWRPIFARWDGGEESRYSDFEESFGRFILNELMERGSLEWNCVTQSNAGRTTRQLEQDSWKRCEWKQFTDAMHDQVADYLNNIEEVACEMIYKELIETPIWPENIRTTPVANIKKEAESPGPRDVRPITLAATLCCAWSSTTKDEKEDGIATAAIDSKKYFDSICWEVTFQMLDRMGLDQRIWGPMLNT